MSAKELLDRYNAGQLLAADYKLLEEYIERGEIAIEDMKDLQRLRSSINTMDTPEPSSEMTTAFYKQLGAAQKNMRSNRTGGWLARLWSAQPALKWAYSIGLIVIGVCAGILLKPDGAAHKDDKLEALTAQVSEMKEMMMLALLEKESPSDRLKAVNLTSQMTEPSGKVTDALFKTLNNDPNVNVRLAALEALYPYVHDPSVREGLVKSISKQKSPMVQTALAEVMEALQEKSSVEALRKIVQDQDTPPEVKERIEKSIQVLI